MRTVLFIVAHPDDVAASGTAEADRAGDLSADLSGVA